MLPQQTLALTPLPYPLTRPLSWLVLAAMACALLPHNREVAEAGVAVAQHFASHFSSHQEASDEFAGDPGQLNCQSHSRFCAGQGNGVQGD